MKKYSLRLLMIAGTAALLIAFAVVPSLAQQTADDSNTSDAESISLDENASTEELLASAREMFLADNYVLSEMLYKGVLVKDPNHLDAMLELAIVYEAIGKLEYSRGLLTRAALLKPEDQEIIRRNNEAAQKLGSSLEEEIEALLAAGKHELAVPKLSVLLTTQPENAELYYERAQCHMALGNPQSAIDDISRALDLRSEDRYFQAKTEAMALLNQNEIRRLTALTKKNILMDTTQSRRAALTAVGRVLELDPSNVWAQETFRDLTDAQAKAKSNMPMGMLASLWHNVQSLGDPASDAAASLVAFIDANLWMLLAVLAVLLVFNSPLTRFLMRGLGPNHLLGGKTQRFSLSEILMLIHSHNATGVLRVTGDTRGDIFFHNGEITHCKSGRLHGETALKEVLQSSNGTFVFEESDIPAEKTIHAPLSLILMDVPAGPATYSMSNARPRIQHSRIKTLLDAKH